MAVRACFVVRSVTKTRGLSREGKNEPGFEVQLFPVADPEGKYKEFFQATPSGDIKLATVNPAAGEQFEPGDTFWVDFTKVES